MSFPRMAGKFDDPERRLLKGENGIADIQKVAAQMHSVTMILTTSGKDLKKPQR